MTSITDISGQSPVDILEAWGDAKGCIINYTKLRKTPTAVVEVRKTLYGGETIRGEGTTVDDASRAAATSALRAWANIDVAPASEKTEPATIRGETPRVAVPA